MQKYVVASVHWTARVGAKWAACCSCVTIPHFSPPFPIHINTNFIFQGYSFWDAHMRGWTRWDHFQISRPRNQGFRCRGKPTPVQSWRYHFRALHKKLRNALHPLLNSAVQGKGNMDLKRCESWKDYGWRSEFKQQPAFSFKKMFPSFSFFPSKTGCEASSGFWHLSRAIGNLTASLKPRAPCSTARSYTVIGP